MRQAALDLVRYVGIWPGGVTVHRVDGWSRWAGRLHGMRVALMAVCYLQGGTARARATLFRAPRGKVGRTRSSAITL